jgi:hypothetical protein
VKIVNFAVRKKTGLIERAHAITGFASSTPLDVATKVRTASYIFSR